MSTRTRRGARKVASASESSTANETSKASEAGAGAGGKKMAAPALRVRQTDPSSGGGGGDGGRAGPSGIPTRRSNRGRPQQEGSLLGDMSLYSQNNEGRDSNMIIFFVLPEGTNEAICSSNLSAAYMKTLDSMIACKWLPEQECLNHDPVFGNVFVMDPFRGPAYERLVKLKNQRQVTIMGPQVIQYILSTKNDPEESSVGPELSSPIPPFTVGMRNLLVCTSGITDLSKRRELEERIKMMCGHISPGLTKGITQVIAEHVVTEKVVAAYEANIPVMKINWVTAVWNDSQENLVHGTDDKYVNYACQIFHNVEICVSQVPSGLKNAIKNTIESNGGRYSPDLLRNKTNVLVVPTAAGAKHKYASQWKIPCVVPDWIEACKNAGHVVGWKNYSAGAKEMPTRVDRIPTSTPNHSIGRLTFDQASMSTVDFDNMRPVDCPTGIVYETDPSDFEALQNVTKMLKTRLHKEPFLDGCQIYISASLKSEEVRKLVDLSGAVRLSKISESVTHVVASSVSPLTESEQKLLTDLDELPHIVSVEWLVQSAQSGNSVDESNFKLPVDGKEKSRNSGPVSITEAVEKAEKLRRVHVSSHELFQPNPPLLADDELSHMEIPAVNPIPPDENVSLHDVESEVLEGKGDVFVGKKFRVECNDASDKSEVTKSILMYGGRISKTSYDFLVLPPVYRGEIIIREGSEMRTKHWVVECIENNILCDIMYCYQPLPEFEGMGHIMKDIVVSISQYTNSEKDYLASLIISMGGKSQDVFAKKPSVSNKGNVERTTHLICNKTDSDKYKAAQRWGVPIVTAEWLLDSFNKKGLQEVEPYHPEYRDSQSSVSYFPRTPKAVPNTTRMASASISHIPPSSTKMGPKQVADNPKTPTRASSPFFKTPVTRARYSSAATPKSTTRDSSADRNNSSIIPDTSSFLEYLRTHPGTPGKEMDNDPAFLAFLAELPPTPEPDPNQLSPIFAGLDKHLTRQQSRNLKAYFDRMANTTPEKPWTITINRRKSTPIKDMIARDAKDLLRRYPEYAPENLGRKYLAGTSAGCSKKRPSEEEIDNDNGEVVTEAAETTDENSPIAKLGAGAGRKRRKRNVLVESSDDDVDAERESSNSKTSFSGNEGRKTSESSVGDGDRSHHIQRLINLYARAEAEESLNDSNNAGVAKPVKAARKNIPLPSPDAELDPEELDQPRVVWMHDDEPNAGDTVLRRGRSGSRTTPETSRGSIKSTSREGDVSESDDAFVGDLELECEDGIRFVVPPNSAFILSGLSEEEKKDAGEKIEKLGGTVLTDPQYNPASTAIICKHVARSEKILCSIASGKPLVQVRYLDECLVVGKFLPITEEYIRHPDVNPDVRDPDVNNVTGQISNAAITWFRRVHIDPEDRPFKNHVFSLPKGNATKLGAYKRLIEAGGGKVTSNKKEANIILAEKSSGSGLEEDGVPVKDIQYLNKRVLLLL